MIRNVSSLVWALIVLTAGDIFLPKSTISFRLVEGTSSNERHSLDSAYPALDLVHAIFVSTASQDFAGNINSYTAASHWHKERLLKGTNADIAGPYLACTEYGKGQDALFALQTAFSASGVQTVSHSEIHGACFIATVSSSDASGLLDDPAQFGLASAGPFLSMLKLAPGLLEHDSSNYHNPTMNTDGPSRRLSTIYGNRMKAGDVRGLTVRLSPGIMQTSGISAGDLIREWRTSLMSKNLDMRSDVFWSDPSMLHSGEDGHQQHRGVHNEEGRIRIREWTRAADVVHGLAEENDKSPGEVCSWDRGNVYHTDDGMLVIQGIDHLLPNDSNSETKMACFMGLVSHLASKNEVLRVAPLPKRKMLNAVAGAVVQSATVTDTPLQDAGLDGTGELIQIVDTGLDETMCYFADEDGDTVEHGHMFMGVRYLDDGSPDVAGDYSFPYDLTRRKVVQYIEAFKVPDEADNGSSLDDSASYFSDFYEDYMENINSSYYSSTYYYADDESYSSLVFPEDSECGEILDDFSYWLSYMMEDLESSSDYSSSSSSTSSYLSSIWDNGFDEDYVKGHGTHTAGTAAGATYKGSPFMTQNCAASEVSACAGECMTPSDAEKYMSNGLFDIETYCPMYGCDGYGADSPNCLGNDVLDTLVKHNGVAPGAKLSIFDIAYDFIGVPDLPGNFLWNSTFGTGTKIHSNSWGYSSDCECTEFDFLYDTFVYENPEHLIAFAAGNDGGLKDSASLLGVDCTVGSPALGKNILTVGSTSNGPSSIPLTGADGRLRYENLGITNYTPEGYPWICFSPSLGLPSATVDEGADIDMVSFFSSYGPTQDGRVKPEIVAPGEQLFSAYSDGTDTHTCRLFESSGTSMSTPIVAGAAALVRQYFTDSSFYVDDVKRRRLCAGGQFACDAFAPYSATVKAMLINSANLMGGSAQPDGVRGFGRVHLEAGMPLQGKGELALFVADASTTTISQSSDVSYTFQVNANAGLELRATLCWLDSATLAMSKNQLQHDLDLTVSSPSGAVFTMWGSNIVDTVNVNERVIVPVDMLESGVWTVTVLSKSLLTDRQSYSLVVTGAISNAVTG